MRTRNLRRSGKLCPVCGVAISDKANTCYEHRTRSVSNPQLIVCPKCGGKKSRKSKTCSACHDRSENRSHNRGWVEPDVSYLDKIPVSFWKEFVGLFCGEGTATLTRTNAGTIAARLSIHMRADDDLLLERIREVLGGALRHDQYATRNTMIKWQISQIHHVKRICELMLAHAELPYKKLFDIAHVLKFCEWRLQQPFHGADFAQAEVMLTELRDIRVFKVQQ